MDEGRRLLTRRFDIALQLASALHHRQYRKGTDIPYISHLMAVAALVLEAGGDDLTRRYGAAANSIGCTASDVSFL